MWSGSAANGGVERALPVGVGLVRRAVDQVEVDVLEPGRAGLGHRRFGTARPVPPVEHLEHVRHGRLHAQRHPGEARLAQLGEVARGHRLGIGLGA